MWSVAPDPSSKPHIALLEAAQGSDEHVASLSRYVAREKENTQVTSPSLDGRDESLGIDSECYEARSGQLHLLLGVMAVDDVSWYKWNRSALRHEACDGPHGGADRVVSPKARVAP
jgi:hypothetical protein